MEVCVYALVYACVYACAHDQIKWCIAMYSLFVGVYFVYMFTLCTYNVYIARKGVWYKPYGVINKNSIAII